MKTNHAHVEAALTAAMVVAIVAVFDLFVEIGDESPFKILAYSVEYLLRPAEIVTR
jgi:hypothetical protein